ncbi:MAG: tagaturonate epimerase family protein [Planctomycetota bacterium]
MERFVLCGCGPHRSEERRLINVDLFLDSSDFFTLDVADVIGQAADESEIKAFVSKYKKYVGSLVIPGIDEALQIGEEHVETIAGKFLQGVKEAGKIYRHIKDAKGTNAFVTEVSMDETDQPQTPVEMLFILAAIADEGIPAQTIAPKFTGRFNKGVDYVGDIGQFAKEFEEDVAVIAFAVKEFGLPESLKLSVHSGSDKFSIYRAMNSAIKKFGAGLHIKTAGTTWLEELIGLALAGGDGLAIAKKAYVNALSRFDELCGPYATVIDIDKAQLPPPEVVEQWSREEYANALRHDQSCDRYNASLRQLLHVGYKIAAEMGAEFLNALEEYEETIAENVTQNIYERHIRPIFVD